MAECLLLERLGLQTLSSRWVRGRQHALSGRAPPRLECLLFASGQTRSPKMALMLAIARWPLQTTGFFVYIAQNRRRRTRPSRPIPAEHSDVGRMQWGLSFEPL